MTTPDRPRLRRILQLIADLAIRLLERYLNIPPGPSSTDQTAGPCATTPAQARKPRKPD